MRSFAVANLLIPLIIPQMTLSNNFALLLVQVGMGRSAASSATYAIPKTLAIILASLLLGKWIIRHPIWQKRFVLISGGLIGGVELLMGLTGSWEAFPALLYGFTVLLGLGEALYYMTLYALYQRDLSPEHVPVLQHIWRAADSLGRGHYGRVPGDVLCDADTHNAVSGNRGLLPECIRRQRA